MTTNITTTRHGVAGVLGMLEQAAPRLKALCRGDFDRLWRLARFAIQMSPGLAECDVRSIIASVGAALQVGLELSGPLAEAYVIPYVIKGVKQARLEISYRGYQKLARLSPARWEIQAFSVREGDKFVVRYGTNPEIVHEPAMSFDGAITHVYAVAKSLAYGMQKWEIMTAQEVERIRARSRASGEASPWATDWEAMAQKTVVRRLCKRWLDLTPEAMDALESETDEGAPAVMAVAAESAAATASTTAAVPAAAAAPAQTPTGLTEDQILRAMDLTARLRGINKRLVDDIQRRYGIKHCGQLTPQNYDGYIEAIRHGFGTDSSAGPKPAAATQSVGTEHAGQEDSMSGVIPDGTEVPF